MKTKSAEDSSDEKPPNKPDDGLLAPMDLPSYNDLLERYLQSKMAKTQLTVSIIEDGSYLLKMNIDPFPPLTCLIPKHDWVLTMHRVSTTVKMTTEIATDVNSLPSTNDVIERGSVSPRKSLEFKKSPLHTSPSTSSPQGDKRNRKSRWPLKVRFHRLGADRYKVIGVAGSSIASESDHSTEKHSGRRGHKKAKKSKRRSSESIDNEEVAYMIDESPVVESYSSNTSSQMLNGSGSSEFVSNGGCHENTLLVANCSLSKMMEAQASSAAVIVAWPSNSENMSVQNDDSDTFIAPAQSLVLHHTWKHKHRRGDSVKVSSYVKRQGTPVSATVSVTQRTRRTSGRVDRVSVFVTVRKMVIVQQE
ncbi:hypothetical protein GCK32_000756 [Trichostrongylus colubriformis]|uniref:Uncharacterized protein n=1 Tax=Trichostrongylus colubriformis TaxID=6319 RepID=A0AAN8J2B7_TRICO